MQGRHKKAKRRRQRGPKVPIVAWAADLDHLQCVRGLQHGRKNVNDCALGKTERPRFGVTVLSSRRSIHSNTPEPASETSLPPSMPVQPRRDIARVTAPDVSIGHRVTETLYCSKCAGSEMDVSRLCGHRVGTQTRQTTKGETTPALRYMWYRWTRWLVVPLDKMAYRH